MRTFLALVTGVAAGVALAVALAGRALSDNPRLLTSPPPEPELPPVPEPEFTPPEPQPELERVTSPVLAASTAPDRGEAADLAADLEEIADPEPGLAPLAESMEDAASELESTTSGVLASTTEPVSDALANSASDAGEVMVEQLEDAEVPDTDTSNDAVLEDDDTEKGGPL